MVERNRQSTGAAREGSPSTPGGIGHQQATQVKEQVQETAANLKEQVTSRATDTLASQKDAASSNLNTVARAFRQTGDQLRDGDQQGIARYTDQAAERIEQFAGYLGDADMRRLARDAESFARREPALFLGGAFAIGLLAGRFLKSSGSGGQGNGARSTDWRGQEEWYGQRSAMASTPPQLPARVGAGGGTAPIRSVGGQPAPTTEGMGASPSTGGVGTASAGLRADLGGTPAAASGTTPGTQPTDDMAGGNTARAMGREGRR